MDTIFMNSKNSKTYDSRRPFLNLLDKLSLKGSDKYAVLSNFNTYHTWKCIKQQIWNIIPKGEWKLPDRSYSASNI